MALLVASPVHAEWNNGQLSDDSIISTANALYSISGDNASESLCQTLAEYDININDDTLIEVRPLLSDNNANVLVVSNTEGNLVIKDILLSFGEDGEIQSAIPENQGDASIQGGSTIEYPYNKTYSIKATAVYNQRTDSALLSSYYQPIGAYFFYYNTGNSTVSYVQIEYFCDGFEYTYPGFQAINNNVEYEHYISVEKNSPAKNTMYHTMKEYRSDRVIWTGSGSPSVGQHMTFTYTVNGTTYSHTTRVF